MIPKKKNECEELAKRAHKLIPDLSEEELDKILNMPECQEIIKKEKANNGIEQ